MQLGRYSFRLAAAAALCLAFSGPAWSASESAAATERSTALPGATGSQQAPSTHEPAGFPSCSRFVHAETFSDGRVEAVERFLDAYSCSVSSLAHEFVLAAELNDLDYRLLPALAVLETGCGRAARNNNLFGWANGRKPFGSFRESIHFVAQRLRVAPHYRDKSLREKLKVYNRRVAYQRKVLSMMLAMPESPEEGSSPAETESSFGFE